MSPSRDTVDKSEDFYEIDEDEEIKENVNNFSHSLQRTNTPESSPPASN